MNADIDDGMAGAAGAALEDIAKAIAPRLEKCANRTERTTEAAAYLFFHHGIYPSAQKVLAVTRKGSISDINSDLKKFWSTLRAKAKFDLDLPEFPEALRHEAESLLRSLWAKSNLKAREFLAELEREAEARVKAAAEKLGQARTKIEELNGAILELRGELATRDSAIRSLELDNQAKSVELEQARQREAGLSERISEQENRRAAEERQYVATLEEERNLRKRDLDVFEKEMSFSKLQIDRAREESKQLRQSLSEERERSQQDISIYRNQVMQISEELSAVRRELDSERAKYAKAKIDLAPEPGQVPHQRKSLAAPRKKLRKPSAKQRDAIRKLHGTIKAR